LVLLLTLTALAVTMWRANAEPAEVASVRADGSGTALFSDDEFRALQLRVATADDLARYPAPAAKLAPEVRVQILESRNLSLSASTFPFAKVRVLSGAARDREGWLQGGSLTR
jgi:hypothetical protein